MDKLTALQNRRTICLACIRLISEADSSDPRREDALIEYNRQLAEIDGRIMEITGKPSPVVIGLKTASLTGKAY